jgi:hypothetical protein
MSEFNDLQQRRNALQTQLSTLRLQRERAFRANSDALSLQRAGVTHREAVEMKGFADDEIAGDSAMTDIRRQIELIDGELTSGRGGGKRGRVLRRLRKS